METVVIVLDWIILVGVIGASASALVLLCVMPFFLKDLRKEVRHQRRLSDAYWNSGTE